MDVELTGGYSVPCERCSAVDWGVSDTGQFYCKSCHNVIERVTEVEETELLSTSSRVTTLSRKSFQKNEKVLGKEWMIIEGFQFVLMHQADALLSLGVCPQFKNDVLWHFWRRYLQTTKQAYTHNPISLGRVSVDPSQDVDLDSAVESEALSDGSLCSGPSLDQGSELSLGASAGHSSDAECSNQVWCGSMDATGYPNPRSRKGRRHLMSMPRTLTLCHLALLWAREAITLADLLRFVSEKHIPYLHIHDVFPEEIKVFGKDSAIFRVESLPSYNQVQEDALQLARVMELPVFPSISPQCLLHPGLLSLRYLTEANLPDELHHWVCEVMYRSGFADESKLTFDHTSMIQRRSPISYEILACALIIVSMKLLFRLNDSKEWKFSEKADWRNFAGLPGSGLFSLHWWYETVQEAFKKAKKREEQHRASQMWKSSKTMIFRKKNRTVYLKRRRVVDHLQKTFQKLSGPSPESACSKPSSFIFRWGEGEVSDGPSFHQTKLNHVVKEEMKAHTTANKKYWHPFLKNNGKSPCKNNFAEVEPSLPRMYVWLLEFFSFVLQVTPSRLHLEVLKVERQLVKCKRYQKRTKSTGGEMIGAKERRKSYNS